MQENWAFKKYQPREKVYIMVISYEFCHFRRNKNVFMKKKKKYCAFKKYSWGKFIVSSKMY